MPWGLLLLLVFGSETVGREETGVEMVSRSKEVIGRRWRVAAAPNQPAPLSPPSQGVRCFPSVSVRVRWCC